MESILVPSVLTLTTLAAFIVGRVFLHSNQGSLTVAFAQMFECVGAAVVFFVLNVGLGITLALVARTIGSQFVSLYILDDVTLVILSLLQGLVFRFWLRSA